MPIEKTEDLVIGSGPCGSLVARELARTGRQVTVLEAGRRFDPAREFQNSEAQASRLIWTEPRVYTGTHPIIPKTGTGVGGGSLVWLGVMPRFHPDDFRTFSREGVGFDWPIEYADLRPHYQKVERDFGVAGEPGPFAPEEYQLPMPPHRFNWHAQVLARGATKLGAKPFAPPMAINSIEYQGRPACIYCGFCGCGCPTGAKATASGTYLAEAERLGARVVSESFVYRIQFQPRTGRVSGARFLAPNGESREIEAERVILATHAIETPRLLLLSACAEFPEGLANRSGCVGRFFMSHPTWQVFGRFDHPIRAYQGMQMGHVMVQDFYRPRPEREYRRGFVLISYMMTPITYANLSGAFHGREFKDFLYDYEYTAAWWAHAEGLPDRENAVTLDPEIRDARGLPVARLTYRWGENDLKVAAAARDQAVEMMRASGAARVRIGLNYGAHAMGGCRMGIDPGHSVVNEFGQSHDVPNLFICDTSLFVTGAGVNPTLTAMAIASRNAEQLSQGRGLEGGG